MATRKLRKLEDISLAAPQGCCQCGGGSLAVSLYRQRRAILESGYPYRWVGTSIFYGFRKSLRPHLQTTCGTISEIFSALEMRQRSCGFGGGETTESQDWVFTDYKELSRAAYNSKPSLNKGFLQELILSGKTKKMKHYISLINKEKLKTLNLFWNGQRNGRAIFNIKER